MTKKLLAAVLAAGLLAGGCSLEVEGYDPAPSRTTRPATTVPLRPVEGTWSGNGVELRDVTLPAGLYTFTAKTKSTGNFIVWLHGEYPMGLANELEFGDNKKEMKAVSVERLGGGNYILEVEYAEDAWTIEYERKGL